MTETQRLLAALSRRPVDRPPVICPGGMMSLAVTEVMDRCGHAWPAAHTDPDQMAALAAAMHELAGLENLAVPFCMTVEAEAFGAPVHLGSPTIQPYITDHPYASCRELAGLQPTAPDDCRMAVVLAAARRLAQEYPQVPVIGNLVGPVSLAGSLVEPGVLLREMYRSPDLVHAALRALVPSLAAFGRAQIAAGAAVVAISEPTATGEILGPRLFAQFGAPYLQALAQELHQAGAPVIVHICGDVRTIAAQLPGIGADAISVDEEVSLRHVRAAITPTPIMGNLSALALEQGPPARIARWARTIALRHADIVAPACGVVPTTPLSHLRALVEAVRNA